MKAGHVAVEPRVICRRIRCLAKRGGHLILANDQMAVIHAEWRRLCSEVEELWKVHPRLLEVLEWQFRKEHGAGPQDRYRTEELMAFACTHQLGLNGKRYREGWRSQRRAA